MGTKTLEKIKLVPLADPIVGMSNICFEFEPKEHSKSLTAIASLNKDLSVATNREQVRVNISSSVRLNSLYTEEREFAPIPSASCRRWLMWIWKLRLNI